MSHYHIHLLLLPPHDEQDELTTIESIHDLLLEGFEWTNDNVVVEFDTIATANNDQQQHCLSITYENTWRAQIHFSEGPHVLREAQELARIHADDLPINAQIAIGAIFRRLTITSDPDPERDYSDDFLALLGHLKHNFSPCYLFDVIHNEFML